MYRESTHIPGGNPFTEEPGLNPMSPVTDVNPVLVIVEPARTTKEDVLASATVAATVV